jgi:hypothetical protein
MVDPGLTLCYSGEYEAPCVCVDDNRVHLITADELIAFAEEGGAKVEEEPGRWAYVVYFSHRWPELYTESALQRDRKLGCYRRTT